MDKKSFRKSCLADLKRISHKKFYIEDKLIAKSIERLVKEKKPKSILVYLPMKIEVDLKSMMNNYRSKCKIFVPFIVKESFKMIKYKLPLKRNIYGIYESPKSHMKIKDVDMIIVPVVGVDGDCKRVGFGKGMYDRFFEKLIKKPTVVFVQRKKCVTKNIVTDSYDIQADFYITPKETIFRGRKYDNRNNHCSRRSTFRR